MSVRHNQGEYDVIMADTIARHKQGLPIFFYTWTPYWVSSVLVPGRDVVWLEVPFSSSPDPNIKDTRLPDGRNLGFPPDNIEIIANKTFLAKNPAARRFFQLVKVPVQDINTNNFLIYQEQQQP